MPQVRHGQPSCNCMSQGKLIPGPHVTDEGAGDVFVGLDGIKATRVDLRSSKLRFIESSDRMFDSQEFSKIEKCLGVPGGVKLVDKRPSPCGGGRGFETWRGQETLCLRG